MYSVSDIHKNQIPIIDLLIKHLQLQEVDELPSGKVYSISAYNAFLLSSIVGCNYLINPVGFCIKGRNEVFIHRSVFQDSTLIYSPGLFSRDINGLLEEGNGSMKILTIFPTLFDEDKKLICIKHDSSKRSNIEQDVYNELLTNNKDPKEYLIIKIHKNSNYEPILELLSLKKFENQGYIFENQAPFFQQNFEYKDARISGGIPDISFFKTTTQNLLYEKYCLDPNFSVPINIIPFLGKALLPNKKNVKERNSNGALKHELLIGEAKSSIASKKQALNQMKKYSYVDLSDDVFGFLPDCQSYTIDGEDFSSLYLDGTDIKYIKKYSGEKNQAFANEDESFLETTIKVNILSSLKFARLKEILTDHYSGKLKNGIRSYHLLNFCLRKSFKEILEYI